MNEKDVQKILSYNIKRYRNFRKFSQAEFAEKAQIKL